MGTIREHRPNLYLEIHAQSLGDEIKDLLDPLYPELETVRHGHYGPGDQWYLHHFWLVDR
jgi:hypothetical protein